MRSFVTLALAATALAVKQNNDRVDYSTLGDQKYDAATDSGVQVDDWNESNTDNYQHFDYKINPEWMENAEGWNDADVVEARSWFSGSKTLLGRDGEWNLARETQWKELVEAAKEKHGELLKTCENGNICRREKRDLLVKELQQDWVRLLKSFHSQIESQITVTGEKIVNVYGELVTCGEDAECCPYDDSVVSSHLDIIEGYWRQIWALELEIKTFDVRVDEIANECPDEFALLEAGQNPNDPSFRVSTDGLTANA
jgi:hypothetical protein